MFLFLFEKGKCQVKFIQGNGTTYVFNTKKDFTMKFKIFLIFICRNWHYLTFIHRGANAVKLFTTVSYEFSY
jgi:hypothetical protein